MFTGIIEYIGLINQIRTAGSNRIFDIKTPFQEDIKVDQSIAHNGVCLTVTDIYEQSPEKGAHYSVTAVNETLQKTNLARLKVNDLMNIERCLRVGDRLDGHFVQGHVDDTAIVESVETLEGSWMYGFRFDQEYENLIVNKGSICVNGVSLTVVKCKGNYFTATIIPYTFEHTNFQQLTIGDAVNLEFDILGKYMMKRLLMEG